MSIYGLKPTFTDLEGYKKWREVWRTIYSEMSARIRTHKQAYKQACELDRKRPTTALRGNVRTSYATLRGAQVAASKLCTVLEEAKIRMSNITRMKREMQEHLAQYPLKVEGCQMIDFHFNKKHLEFSWIPMWVVKAKGKTFYVHHVDGNAPWTTRETPDHASTKGSLRFRRCDLTIDKDGVATITPMKVVETS